MSTERAIRHGVAADWTLGGHIADGSRSSGIRRREVSTGVNLVNNDALVSTCLCLGKTRRAKSAENSPVSKLTHERVGMNSIRVLLCVRVKSHETSNKSQKQKGGGVR